MSRWQMYFFRCWIANSFTKYFSRLVPTSRPVVHIMCFTYTCTGTQQLLCRHFESLHRRTHTHTQGLIQWHWCVYVSVSRQRAFSLHLFRYDCILTACQPACCLAAAWHITFCFVYRFGSQFLYVHFPPIVPEPRHCCATRFYGFKLNSKIE